MAEEPQFHITVVTQQRRPRSHEGKTSHHGAHRQSDAPGSPQPKAETPGSDRAPAEATGASAAAASHPSAPEARHEHSSAHAHSRSREGRSHRRHYKDYGTLNLGTLDGGAAEDTDFTDDPNGPTPTQGEMQRQFYKKYDAILNRRYFSRNRNKVTRVILIALLVALIFLVSVIGINAIHGSVAETLERPEVSTVPVETLDLG